MSHDSDSRRGDEFAPSGSGERGVRDGAMRELDRLLFARADGVQTDAERTRLAEILGESASSLARSAAFDCMNAALAEVATGDAAGADVAALLRRAEAELAEGAPVARVEKRTDERRSALRRVPMRWLGYTVAAAVLIIAAIGVRVAIEPGPEPIDAHRMFALVAPRMSPRVVCDTRDKFEAYTKEAFGRVITADFAAGVSFIGWNALDRQSYDPDQTIPGRRLLLARADDGAPVLVVFDPLGGETPELTAWPPFYTPPREGDELFVHTDSIDGLRVYELSTRPTPVVIPLLTVR